MKTPPFVSSRVLAAASNTLEITIYGDIGEDFWTGEGITPASVKKQMDAAGKFDQLSVRINSPGGSAFDGVAIYNVLRSAGKPVAVIVDGLAASAASIIAMAGDTVTMGRGSMLMLHNPWTIAVGNSADLHAQAVVLEKIADSMNDVYVTRSGKTKDEIKAVLDAETWLSAQDAVDQGFADSIAEGSAKALAAAKEFPLLAKLRNVPEALKAKEPEAQPDPPEAVAPPPEAQQEVAAVASEAAPAGEPPAENLTVLRERFKIKHKKRTQV
jgi:ATP-dependent Clp protease protease subunit